MKSTLDLFEQQCANNTTIGGVEHAGVYASGRERINVHAVVSELPCYERVGKPVDLSLRVIVQPLRILP